jgi:phenylacetate-coenzyme A ligase PaaK-like adenylate-forming protein
MEALPCVLSENVAMTLSNRSSDLTAILAYALDDVPYYRGKHAIYGAASDLAELPILERSDIRANLLELTPDSCARHRGAMMLDGRLETAHTSGSTGDRLMVVADMTLARVPPEFQTVWGLPGLSPTPVTAVLTSPICTSKLCGSRDGRATFGGAVTFLPTTDNPFDLPIERIQAALHAIQPEFLLAHPTYLHCLLRGLKEPPSRSVRAVLLSYQLAGAQQRQVFSEAFAAPVFDLYAATELAGAQIGVQCRRGHLHVREDHVIVEILAAPGEIGELLVTTAAARTMVLVRYRTGDLARFTAARCDCELGDWQTFELHGRAAEALDLDDGHRLTTRATDARIAAVAGCSLYQIVQRRSGSTLAAVVPDPVTPLDEGALRAALDLPALTIKQVPRFATSWSMKYPLTRKEVRRT